MESAGLGVEVDGISKSDFPISQLAEAWWIVRRAGFASTAEKRVKPTARETSLADEAADALISRQMLEDMGIALLERADGESDIVYLLDYFRITCADSFHPSNYLWFAEEVGIKVQQYGREARDQWQRVKDVADAANWKERANQQLRSLERYWPDAPEAEVKEILLKNGVS